MHQQAKFHQRLHCIIVALHMGWNTFEVILISGNKNLTCMIVNSNYSIKLYISEYSR